MKEITYKKAGVDINTSNLAKKLIKNHVRFTFNKNVLVDIGLFGGVLSINELKKYKHPALVLSMDGVGTKTMIASMMNKWDTIGFDIVNHSINDILVQGAKPLYFLDYIASDKLNPKIVEQIVRGISIACKKSGIVLIGGETAEMPKVYLKNNYDIVGCIGGVVEKYDIINGSKIKEGDILIGLASSGLHTNGYSLARYVLFEKNKLNVNSHIKELKTTVGNALLEPHREYASIILPLLKRIEIKGMAHITGGGFIENIPRIIPEGLGVEIYRESWKIPKIFSLIKKLGNISDEEMCHVFNMGIGLIVIADEKDKKMIVNLLRKKINAYFIGRVVKGNGVIFKGKAARLEN